MVPLVNVFIMNPLIHLEKGSLLVVGIDAGTFIPHRFVWELVWRDCWIGVCGFLALCSWLAWKSPSFSTLGRYDLIQSSAFLLGRFRLDVWWWELPLLLRGDLDEFLFSACRPYMYTSFHHKGPCPRFLAIQTRGKWQYNFYIVLSTTISPVVAMAMELTFWYDFLTYWNVKVGGVSWCVGHR